MSSNLPPSISWNGAAFQLRFALPKIWTQRKSRPFGIYWSKSLRHGLLYPPPTGAELAEFYDIPCYGAYLSGMPPGQRTIHSGVLNRVMVKLAYTFDHSSNDPVSSIVQQSQTAHPSLCDIGCGSGEFLARMREHGFNVAGLDPSSASGTAVLSRGIEFHQGTAEKLPLSLGNRTFDVVTMFHSLEHCRDPVRALANAKTILHDAGLFVVEVPNINCLGFRLYRQAWFHTDAGRHLQFFTTHSLTTLCSQVGLQPIAIEYAGFTVQFTKEWISAMSEVWDQLFSDWHGSAPPRPSSLKSLAYFVAAVAAPKHLKYDVIRLYARPSGSPQRR